ncbi:GroES-like protein [Aaosphaeria arxii CBS 175.79]|uniref:GroES-like protein n=1 Tax=Aaosphaeria arxii CBS 175.79 TaxID=1450172 RepID=A0A6A5Y2S1_9PLEO|nr:GroES-like protein [Aaosphaeria arxii CBS 175.79]KAF2019100.1 GroES-like protein [Aaosphaeria arxii CBS 175.79]
MSQTTTINRAAIYADPGTPKIEVLELPIPEPGPGEVLVRLLYSGVCHTDYAFCTNGFPHLPVPTQKGQIGGHEGIGEVIAQGTGVKTPQVGSKVGIKFAADACLACSNCLEGGETSCAEAKISGYYTPGTFQQYCISTARYLSPIPDGLDLAAAAPLMCGGVTVYTALVRSHVRNGDWVLVSGAGGGLGHLAIQYAKALGARVLAIDHGSKKQFCQSLGADEFLDFTMFQEDKDLSNAVLQITSGGARIGLMCSSSPRTYANALSWLGFRGHLVCLGVPEVEGSLTPSIGEMINNEITISAIKAGNRREVQECLQIAASGAVKTHYELRKLDDLGDI